MERVFDLVNEEFNKYLDKVDLLSCVLAFSWAVYAWETYLSYRQCTILKTVQKVPKEVEGVMDQETFTKARLYHLDSKNFAFWNSIFSQIEITIFLWYYLMHYVWTVSGSTVTYLGYSPDNEILLSVAFIVYTSVYSLVTSLPWSLYSTFVIEERHGFNKQTLGFFLKDTLKKWVVSILLLSPIMLALIQIIKMGGTYFFVYAWIFCSITVLAIVSVYADFIAPFFDKFTPLPEGDLRSKIEDLARSIHFPLTKLYVVEGSKRSSHSNAYFYGFFKNKRIVLFDTLFEESPIKSKQDNENVKSEKDNENVKSEQDNENVKSEQDNENVKSEQDNENVKSEQDNENVKSEQDVRTVGSETNGGEENDVKSEKDINDNNTEDSKSDKDGVDGKKDGECGKERKEGCSTEEILAVLGHELGHWQLNHILKNILISQVNMFLLFLLFALFSQNQLLFSSFGFTTSTPTLIGLVIIFQFLFSPYNEVISFLMTMLSRRFEFQADQFAVDLMKGVMFKSALVKLNRDNLGFPVTDHLYSTFHFSHPPLLERLAAIDRRLNADRSDDGDRKDKPKGD